MTLQKTQQASKVRYMQLTPEQKETAIELAAAGKTLQQIREALGIDHMRFWRAREEDAAFSDAFARARREGLEELADGLATIKDTEPDVQRARLHSENIRWLLSKRKPEGYGENININLNQMVDISGALLEAKKRAALPASDLAKEVEAEVVDIKELSPNRPTGSKPAASKDKDADESASDDIFK